MKKEHPIEAKYHELANSIFDCLYEIKNAITRVSKNPFYVDMNSISGKTLDWNLLENDINFISEKIINTKAEKPVNLLREIILDSKKDLMVLNFYEVIGEKANVYRFEFKVSKLKNFPQDILIELKRCKILRISI